jgi:hypothetical protein
MSKKVYANGRGVACKKSNGKSICAFPDVCMSPPSPPAGPIPIPYPNTGMASDTTSGSKSVKINGAEVMLKNKSYFKKSTGDEAATKSFGMNVLSHQIQGKVYFASWSMDVKIEGENAVRHMDLTTHNHASNPPGTPPWMHADEMAFVQSNGKVCEDQKDAEKSKCEGAPRAKGGKGVDCSNHPGCAEAKACILQPKKKDKSFCCAPDMTGHHLVEVHCFTATGGRKSGASLKGFEAYDPEEAPCMCASSQRHKGTHGVAHSVQGRLESEYFAQSGPPLATWAGAGPLLKKGGSERGPAVSKWNYGQARDAGLFALKQAHPHCNVVCAKNQLDEYHAKCGISDDKTPVRTDPVPRKGGPLSQEQTDAVEGEVDRILGDGIL